jgi:hypothetical protein
VSKVSCGLPVVEFQQASQPLSDLDLASGFTDPVSWHREQDHIPLALMVSLSVIIIRVLREHLPQGSLAEQDQFRQALLFYRSMPPLQIRIQIRTPWRQFNRLDPDRLQDPSERRAEFCISIMQQMRSRVILMSASDGVDTPLG